MVKKQALQHLNGYIKHHKHEACSGEGAMGAKPPPDQWILFLVVFRPQQVLSPPGKRKKFKHPPGQIPEYTPDYKSHNLGDFVYSWI